MDKYSWGFLLSVIFDIVITIILLVIFCLLKKYRCSPNTEHKYKVFIPENSLKFKDLCLKIFSTTLEEIKQECGEEAHHYLYITKTLAILITVLCPITEAILIPVYKQGDSYIGDMFVISLGNILYSEKLLAAPFLIFIIFIASSYYILKVFVIETLKSSSFTNLNSSSLRILKLPQDVSRKSILNEVANCLNITTDNVYVVPNLSKAIEYDKLLNHAKEELLHYLDVEKFKGKRETIKLKYFSNEKVDAIEHWEKQVNVFAYKLENEYKESATNNSGICIVKVLPNTRIEDLRERVYKKFNGAYLTTVVIPEDVKWENIENDENTARFNHVLSTLLFFFLFIVLFTPTSFLTIIYSLLSSIGMADILIGLLGVYAPNIMMLIYQLLIVPAAVAYLVKREKHYSKSAEVISSMRKFLLFFLFSMLFIPAIGLGVVNIVALALDTGSFNSFSEEITRRIYESILWFTVVILTQTFIVNIADLVKIGIIIEMKYRALRAIGEREAYKAYVPDDFYYAYEYSMLVTCFTIVLLFSIVYPLILIFGSAYLWVRVMDI